MKLSGGQQARLRQMIRNGIKLTDSYANGKVCFVEADEYCALPLSVLERAAVGEDIDVDTYCQLDNRIRSADENQP